MTLIRTVDPSAEPVTVAGLRQHLRLDHGSEDDFLTALLRAARQETERATGLALIDQNWRLALDRLPDSGRVALAVHPVREILSVTVYGSDGEASLVSPSGYELDTLSRPARLHFEARPTPLRAMNGIEIDFSAGFGEAGTDVPDTLRRAIVLLAAHWYEFRSSFGPQDQPVSYPAAYERLIAGYRARRL